MKGNRDDVVSSYVRKRIEEWREDGRELQDLARTAGFGKSTPSQILMGTGVGAKTGPGFAKAFGFRSYDELKMAAWSWWSEEGGAGKPRAVVSHTDAMDQAIEMVESLGRGSRDEAEAVLSAYGHPRFRDRDAAWWLQTLLSELAHDRDVQNAAQKLRGQKKREQASPTAPRRPRR